jgi:signal peptidase
MNMDDDRKILEEDPVSQMRLELSALEERQDAVAAKRGVRRKKVNKVWKIIEFILFILTISILAIVLLSVLSAKQTGKTPEVFGYRLYTVQSGSMEPTFKIGALLISVHPKDPSDLSEGDIITFINSRGRTITHRIVDVVLAEDGTVRYQTKGDNPINDVDSELVTPEMIEAVFVLKIPLT